MAQPTSIPAGDELSRPLSPHLQVWRWHATMAASILHRVTGVGLGVAAALLVAWLIIVAAGPRAYAPVDWLFHSWFGQIGLYGTVALAAFHTVNGVRHLLWDMGRHFKPARAEASAWIALVFAALAPAALFACLFFLGGEAQ
jgi:succinate dehydrogenase / fumarate reductase cytochrome b subunit